MRVLRVDELAALSPQELEDVVLESDNTPNIRRAALQRWHRLMAEQHAGHDPWATVTGDLLDRYRDEDNATSR